MISAINQLMLSVGSVGDEISKSQCAISGEFVLCNQKKSLEIVVCSKDFFFFFCYFRVIGGRKLQNCTHK